VDRLGRNPLVESDSADESQRGSARHRFPAVNCADGRANRECRSPASCFAATAVARFSRAGLFRFPAPPIHGTVVRADGHGGAGFADRVREYGQPLAGASESKETRDCGAAGSGRGARPAHPPIADGEFAAGLDRSRSRPGILARGERTACAHGTRNYVGNDGRNDGRSCADFHRRRCTRAGFHRGAVRFHNPSFRPRAGVSRDAGRSGKRVEGESSRRSRGRTDQRPKAAGGFTDGSLSFWL